jgi:hypothetical protein
LVGGCTKDKDARYGHAAGHMGQGYKLHAIWSERPVPETWEVTPLNVHEREVARRLVPQLQHGVICWSMATTTPVICLIGPTSRVIKW